MSNGRSRWRYERSEFFNYWIKEFLITSDDLFFTFFFSSLKNLNNKLKDIIKVINSDTSVVTQIPSPPNNFVSTNKLIITKTKLLPRDIIAEHIGLSMATKNPEMIKLNPKNKKENEYN